jgi:GNAT superfamily N-acetyltransferase
VRPVRSATKKHTTFPRTCCRIRVPSSTKTRTSRSRTGPRDISDRFLRTLGIRTDIQLNASRSNLEERGAFLVVRTPSNPGYYFGNYLIAAAPPECGDYDRWVQAFDNAFAGDPKVRHAAFAFAGAPEGDALSEFVRNGFVVEAHVVMAASRVEKFLPPAGIAIRALHSQSDWDAQMDMQMAARDPQHDELLYRSFKERQIEHHRQLSERIGAWIGAFDGERLAGSCGIFNLSGLARYQDVAVHPAYRNRGVGSAIVSAAGLWAVDRFKAQTLLIVAKRVDFPRKIYERLGFAAAEFETHLWKARR